MNNRYNKYILLVFMLLCSRAAFGQSPAYYGGKGDGYAMAELNGAMVSVHNNEQQDLQIWVYPNPIQQGAALHCRLPLAGAYYIAISDLAGRCIYTKQVNTPAADIALDFKAVQGTYILSINCSDYKSNSLITVQ